MHLLHINLFDISLFEGGYLISYLSTEIIRITIIQLDSFGIKLVLVAWFDPILLFGFMVLLINFVFLVGISRLMLLDRSIDLDLVFC